MVIRHYTIKWLMLLILVATAPSYAAILRVNASASGINADGSSWEKAFTNLTVALESADSGDELWVAAGTYHPAPSGGSRSASFTLPNAVAVYGGFSGMEAIRDARNPHEHPSILSGDIVDDDLKAGKAGAANNSYCVVRIENAGSEYNRLDGFTITGGRAFTWPYTSGGGLNIETSYLTVSQCHFTGNTAQNNGGAAYVKDSIAAFDNCNFSSNGSYGFGAAIAVYKVDAPEATSVRIEGCSFEHNESNYAVMASFAQLSVHACYFLDNESGALCARDHVGLTAQNCVFTHNGGISGGAIYIGTSCDAVFTHCTHTDDYVADMQIIPDKYLVTRVSILNGILWNTWCLPIEYESDYQDNVEFTISNTIIKDGFSGTANLDVEPRFRLCDPPGQLNWDSPAIDAAADTNVNIDILRKSRPQNEAPDIGAYEFGADSDDGGLPDEYEEAHALNPSDRNDDAIDSDGDHLSNLEEYRRGTDPRDDQDPRAEYYINAITGNDTSGDGTASSPWQTITHALSQIPEGVPGFIVILHLSEGIYEERIDFKPYVHIIGAGISLTAIQYFNESNDTHYVVKGNEECTLKDCTVTLPQTVTATTELLRIEAVAMSVSNVIFHGKDSPHTIAVFVSGPKSSPSSIEYCEVRRVEYGVYAVDSGINVTRNLFEDISEVGVFIRPPEGKATRESETPILGNANNGATTGFNRFLKNVAIPVINTSSTSAVAEYNDWGVYTESEIEARVSQGLGQVDFIPFLGKSILSGYIAIELRDDITNTIIPDSVDPKVVLNDAEVARDTESGLFLFSAIPRLTYFAEATAIGYFPASRDLIIDNGAILMVTMSLTSDVSADPCDVNMDGDVDAVDLQCIINAVLEIPSSFACDVNNDKDINALDIQTAVNALLAKTKNDFF